MIGSKPNWAPLDTAMINRCTLWEHALSEAIENIGLLQLPEALGGAGVLSPADRVWPDNAETDWILAKRHLRQHLSVKVQSVFGYSGDPTDGSDPIAKNKVIEVWRPCMEAHACSLGANVAFASALVTEMRDERGKLVAQKDGVFAELSYDDEGSTTFKAFLPPLEPIALTDLKFHLRACRNFVTHAALLDGKPTMPKFTDGRYLEASGRWE